MASRRCNDCWHDWPNQDDYMQCPLCQTLTQHVGGAEPMPRIKAKKLVSTVLFEKYYEDRGPRPLKTHADGRNYLEEYILTVARAWWQHVLEMIPRERTP